MGFGDVGDGGVVGLVVGVWGGLGFGFLGWRGGWGGGKGLLDVERERERVGGGMRLGV